MRNFAGGDHVTVASLKGDGNKLHASHCVHKKGNLASDAVEKVMQYIDGVFGYEFEPIIIKSDQ